MQNKKILSLTSFTCSLILSFLLFFSIRLLFLNMDYFISDKVGFFPIKYRDLEITEVTRSDREIYEGTINCKKVFRLSFDNNLNSNTVSIGTENLILINCVNNVVREFAFYDGGNRIVQLNFDRPICAIGTQTEGQILYYDIDMDGKTDCTTSYIADSDVFDSKYYTFIKD